MYIISHDMFLYLEGFEWKKKKKTLLMFLFILGIENKFFKII